MAKKDYFGNSVSTINEDYNIFSDDDIIKSIIEDPVNEQCIDINEGYKLSEQQLERIDINEGYKLSEKHLENHKLSEQQLEEEVNHPARYNQGGVECIDAIKAGTVNKKGIEAVCVGNVIKYLWRYENKNGLEDVKKAQWYLNRLIEELEHQ